MPAAVDILQKFASEDLFDAELDEDSDNNGGHTGASLEDVGSIKAPELFDLSGDEKAANEEPVNHASDEENSPTKKKDRKKKSRKKSPKPRRIKKADVLAIHSESQRMVRESVVKLPYHVPMVQPITHFLKRVPGLVDDKETDRTKGNKATPVSPPKQEGPFNSKDKPYDISSPLPGDTATPSSAVNGVQGITATTPKLSAATDPFFLNATPTPSLTDHHGVQSLMKRFVQHTSKPQEKLKVPLMKERKIDEHTSEHTSLNDGSKLNTNTPGARFQFLKEQLQKKMKVQRAEKRKIQESQWKLDNEEISEEEEAEDDAEETDEEDDSDYELDKWNKDDERKQEEGDSDLDETAEREENKAIKSNAFIDDEADESDDADDGVCDIDSGSEGGVSDGSDSDGDDDDKSVFSDDKISSISKDVKEKRAINSKQVTVNRMEEQTLDLFNDSNSQSATKERGRFTAMSNVTEDNESGGSFGGLNLRLDSVEDCEDMTFNFPRSAVNSKVGSKGNKSKPAKSLTYFSELSQESSQSSTCTQRLVNSELRESANSLEASSDSSRIPPGQGDGVGKNGEMCSEREMPELFSSFARLRHLINPLSEGSEQATKKPGKLSQLTLPVEDSQDLFDDEHDRNGEHDRQERTGAEPTNDFHFSLDEDTQFTQILNTQGFINSAKKSKSKGPKLFEVERATSTQPCMDELLGLCSGGFTDSNCTQSPKPAETNGKKIGQSVFSQFDMQNKQSNMNELLGLCSGRFTDDEGQETNEEMTDIKMERERKPSHMDQGQKCDDEEEEGEGNGEDKEESDPEEMVLKRKYGKKYETKKRGIFHKRNFLEEEAELSGSDMGSDEDDDIATDEDVIEEESEVEDIPTDEELQKQINRVHMKSMRDQDNAELRAMKEMFLPDGDLYTDGQGRTRHFRWRGIDENSQFDFFGNKELWGEDEDVGTELVSEEEIKRRRERYERETFLREEVSKEKRGLLDIDESSQNILNIIRDTTSQLAEGPNKPQAIVDPKKNMAPAFKRKATQKGSFLNHSKAKLSRLSSLTSNTPNASATTRGFVFHSVSPPNKDQTKGKKIQRTNSAIDLPTSKKPRLDRSLSDSNSVFAML